MSRPAEWAKAQRQANRALSELQDVRDQLLYQAEELTERWQAARQQFSAAIDDLILLQSEYASWVVPENLLNGRTQEKLDAVASLNFDDLASGIPDLDSLLAPLRTFSIELFSVCSFLSSSMSGLAPFGVFAEARI